MQYSSAMKKEITQEGKEVRLNKDKDEFWDHDNRDYYLEMCFYTL